MLTGSALMQFECVHKDCESDSINSYCSMVQHASTTTLVDMHDGGSIINKPLAITNGILGQVDVSSNCGVFVLMLQYRVHVCAACKACASNMLHYYQSLIILHAALVAVLHGKPPRAFARLVFDYL